MSSFALIPSSPLENKILHFLNQKKGDFEELILEVFAFQYNHCPPYSAFCQQTSPPLKWQEIPAVPLSAFRDFPLCSFPAEKTVRTFRTSGTTGNGHGFHHFSSLSLYEAAALKGWKLAGLPDLPVVALVPNVGEAPHSSLSQMAAWLAPSENFLFGKWENLRQKISALGPCVLFGTALSFLDLFESLGSDSLSLPFGCHAVETGGYKGTRRKMPKPELYQLFKEKLGLESDVVWNEYGMTELSSQFYSRGLGHAHISPPWARAIVIDPKTGLECEQGEIGLLRIFDLANLWSVCAIQTRDLAIRRGADFELLGRDPAALPRGCSRAADDFLT